MTARRGECIPDQVARHRIFSCSVRLYRADFLGTSPEHGRSAVTRAGGSTPAPSCADLSSFVPTGICVPTPQPSSSHRSAMVPLNARLLRCARNLNHQCRTVLFCFYYCRHHMFVDSGAILSLLGPLVQRDSHRMDEAAHMRARSAVEAGPGIWRSDSSLPSG